MKAVYIKIEHPKGGIHRYIRIVGISEPKSAGGIQFLKIGLHALLLIYVEEFQAVKIGKLLLQYLGSFWILLVVVHAILKSDNRSLVIGCLTETKIQCKNS